MPFDFHFVNRSPGAMMFVKDAFDALQEKLGEKHDNARIYSR